MVQVRGIVYVGGVASETPGTREGQVGVGVSAQQPPAVCVRDGCVNWASKLARMQAAYAGG